MGYILHWEYKVTVVYCTGLNFYAAVYDISLVRAEKVTSVLVLYSNVVRVIFRMRLFQKYVYLCGRS